MNIVAVVNTQDTWSEVKGKRTGGTWIDAGWIKSNNLSFDEVDIATAKFALAAMDIEDESKKLEALNDILENGDLSSSTFITDIRTMVIDLTPSEEELDEEPEELEEVEETDSIQ